MPSEPTRRDLSRRDFLKYAAGLAGVGAALPLLAACGSQAPATPAKPAATSAPAPAATTAAAATKAPAVPSGAKFAMKFGHVLAPTEPIHKAAEEWGKKVAERTSGAATITVFPSSSLGNNRDTYEQAILGAPVLCHSDPGYMMDYVPDFGVLQGPFLVNSFDQFDRVWASPWFADLCKQLEGKGLHVLAYNWAFGSRHIIAGKPVRNPDEMKGMKFRVPPNQMWIETIKAMGGTPTPLEWAEVYSGLSQGVIDGAEAPLSTLWGSKLYEAKKVITLTGHFMAITGIVIGEKYWQTLPADIQKVLVEEAVNHGKIATKNVLESEQQWLKRLETEGGCKIEKADVESFRKATEVVYTKFDKWSPGLHDKVKAILKG